MDRRIRVAVANDYEIVVVGLAAMLDRHDDLDVVDMPIVLTMGVKSSRNGPLVCLAMSSSARSITRAPKAKARTAAKDSDSRGSVVDRSPPISLGYRTTRASCVRNQRSAARSSRSVTSRSGVWVKSSYHCPMAKK